MAGTRSSARLSNQGSSPPSGKGSGGATKRKADDTSSSTPTRKRGRPSKASKQQKTLEETLPDADKQDGERDEEEMKDAEASTGEGESFQRVVFGRN